MYLKLYLQSCGGILDLRRKYRLILCGLSIVRGIDLKLLNGDGVLKHGSTCYWLETILIKRFGGNLNVVMLVYGLIIRLRKEHCSTFFILTTLLMDDLRMCIN